MEPCPTKTVHLCALASATDGSIALEEACQATCCHRLRTGYRMQKKKQNKAISYDTGTNN